MSRSRATTATGDARAKLFFCQSKPIAFFAVRRRRCKKLPIVVIHKFCYHGNVTSHLSTLLRAVEKLKHLRLCLGEEPGGPGHPLFLDQTEVRTAEKLFLGDGPPPLISGSG